MTFQMGLKPSFFDQNEKYLANKYWCHEISFSSRVLFYRSKAESGIWIVGEVGEGNGLRT
jgi:hypothetical protein